MKFKVEFAALLILLCTNAFADSVFLPPGQNLTYGSSSNNQSIMSSIANPAAAAAQLGRADSQYRFGIFSVGAGYELGDVNDLFDQIDQAETDLENPISDAEIAALYTPGDTAATLGPEIANHINNISPATDTLNDVLQAVQKDGHATVFFGGHVPLTPFVVSKKGWGGSFVLDANVSVVANMTFIADPVFISDPTGVAIADAYLNSLPLPTPPNDSTLLVKAAAVGEIGFGYSRSVLRREAPALLEGESVPGKLSASELTAGELTAGVRVKYYQVKLAHRAERLTNSSNGSKNTLEADQTYTANTGVGLDWGALWTSRHYRAGAWINNINKPSFKYNTITAAELGTPLYTNLTIMNQLTKEQTYEMKPQLQLEGAVFSESQNWVVNLGLDANAVPDPVGRDFQWMTLSTAYATDSWWIPGVRVGYRSNLAGSKLSYATGGVTLFKALSLDVAYGLKSVKDNKGQSLPRSAMVNLNLQMTF